MYELWVGNDAQYNGHNRPWLCNLILEVLDENASAVKFRAPNRNGEVVDQWCSKGSMILVGRKPKLNALMADTSVDFISQAAGTELERVQSEIKRLRDRLEDLEETEAFLMAGGNTNQIRRITAVLSSI